MKSILSKVSLAMAAIFVMACLGQNVSAQSLTETDNTGASTLIVYYSYTNNCRDIVTTLTSQISADVLEIQPAEKGLRYEANGYALGTQLLNAINAAPNNASSYPAIDPVEKSLDNYNNVIIVTPLWWSQMAAIMQTYLFNYGSQMNGKNIGLIVSSASSGISGVVADCKRLVPNGNYFSQNLWINNSNRSNRSTLIANWLSAIDFNTVTSIKEISSTPTAPTQIYDLNGRLLVQEPSEGIYIKDGKKIVKQ